MIVLVILHTSDREPAGHARGPIPKGAPGGDDDDDDAVAVAVADGSAVSSLPPPLEPPLAPERSISHCQVLFTTANISAFLLAINACCSGLSVPVNTILPNVFLLLGKGGVVSVGMVLLDLTVLKKLKRSLIRSLNHCQFK